MCPALHGSPSIANRMGANQALGDLIERIARNSEVGIQCVEGTMPVYHGYYPSA